VSTLRYLIDSETGALVNEEGDLVESGDSDEEDEMYLILISMMIVMLMELVLVHMCVW
jgi:hypothetical protein